MQNMRLQLIIQPDVLERLEKIARENGLSRSAMVRYLIMSYRSESDDKGADHRGDTTTPPMEIIDH